jgi:hypothetical protein
MITHVEQLRQRVWELGRDEANPYAVTATLRAELTTAIELGIAVDVALAGWVRHIMTTQLPPAEPKPTGEPVKYDDGQGGWTYNPNLAAASNWWARQLEQTLRVGEQDYQPLGVSNATQLRFAASVRRAKAEEDLAAARRFEKLAAALEENNAATVADLSPEVGEAIMRK